MALNVCECFVAGAAFERGIPAVLTLARAVIGAGRFVCLDVDLVLTKVTLSVVDGDLARCRGLGCSVGCWP